MTTSTASAPRTRRRRNPTVSPAERIIDATVTEIANDGLARLSVDRVAARAAASKTTIYELWRTKDELVVSTFEAIADPPPKFYNGDGLREALRRMFEHVRNRNRDVRYRTMHAELFAAAQTNDAVRELVVDVDQKWRNALVDMLANGRDDGELPGDTDVEFLAEMIDALNTYRTVYPSDGDGHSEGVWRRLVALVFDAPPRLQHATTVAS